MYSRVVYSGSGSPTPYAVPFPYLDQSHIEVRINDVLQASSTYSWISSAALSITAPAGSYNLDIRRNTPAANADVTFQDGSTLTDDDLNLQVSQLLYIYQEQLDAANISLMLGSGNVFAAGGRRIANLGAPLADTDAATLGTARNLVEQAVAGVVGGYGYFLQNGTGAFSRTFQDKQRESVTPQDFMTDAQKMNVYLRLGTLDVSAAIQSAVNAANSGLVTMPGGYYQMASGVFVSTGTVIQGAGRKATVLVPVGTFDAFTFNGATQGAGLIGVGFTSSAHTGISISVNSADRLTFRDILMDQPYNGFQIIKSNVCSISNFWAYGVRGQFGINYYGDAANRSDVLDLSNVQLSCITNTAGANGIIMDGNVNTLSMRHVACVNMNRSFWARNTSGGPNPAFCTAYDFQSDFSRYEAIRLEGTARGFFFNELYAHGSALSDGIYIDPTVDHVEIMGGQIDSHYQRGVYAGGRYIRIHGVANTNNSMQGSALWANTHIGPSSIGVSLVGGMSGQRLGYAANLASWGVLTDVGAQGYSVTGVNLRGNVSGSYFDPALDGTSQIFGNVTTSSAPNKIAGPIQAQTGDLFLNGALSYTVKLGNETNGIGFAAAPSGALSVNYLKAYGNPTGSSPVLQASGPDANVSMRLSTTGTGIIVFGSTIVPAVDNVYSLGSSVSRMAGIWSSNPAISTSDVHLKTDVEESKLGLSFINQLRPVSYKFISGGKDIVRYRWFDENGVEIAEGAPIPDTAIQGDPITVDKPGVRVHYGMIAQEVKATVDLLGLDFGGHIQADKADPTSMQGLRYEEFIAPLIKAVQELSAEVETLKAQLAAK